MAPKITWKERLNRTLYFFPVQLFLVHIKSNHLLLLSWIFITGIVWKKILSKYGGFNLFLYPEYLGKVSFTSHIIMGIALGGFLVSFNLASYALNGYKFPILATLNRPFIKYSLNNSFIPLVFFVSYFYQLYNYQFYHEMVNQQEILIHIGGVVLGIFLFVFIANSYFLSTNKNLEKLFGDLKRREKSQKHKVRPVKTAFSKKEHWFSILARKREWKVVTYLTSPYRIALARDISHYDAKMLRTVFAQNHINATFFEIGVIISIIFFGFYRETSLLKLPAAASILLTLTMLTMMVSAIYSWLKGWSTLVFVFLFIGYNHLSNSQKYSFRSYAYGLGYDHLVEYSNQRLKAFSRDTIQLESDAANAQNILENWKKNNTPLYKKKPKLVIVNCSGGGIRASAWTLRVLQHLDSLTNGTFMKRTHLITGSSGGMLGAGYYRELAYRKITEPNLDLQDPIYYAKITSDALNTIALNFALHDWLIRVKTFEQAGQYYTKDRGYAFERQLSANTDYFMDKQLVDYDLPVKESDIPMMLLSPTISNDGRQLLISSQPVSFLTQTNYLDNLNHVGLVGSVDYRQLFKNNQPDSLSFLTALRMSATFFYVLPNIYLPTYPPIEAMDAGIRDNYGSVNTIRYITEFLDWINENTSGVVVIQIRDRYKTVDILEEPNHSFIESFTRPLEVLSENYLTIQNYNQDDVFMQMSGLLKDKISIVNFQLKRTRSEDISLSWHLTNEEKSRIYNSIYEPENQKSTELVKILLDIKD